MIGSAGRTTFDSFNNFLIKGDAAQGLEYLFDSLMARALDEPDAVYGLVAATADVAPDGHSVVFKLRPEAKFADGTPVTAEDVVFSFIAHAEGEGAAELHAAAARCRESRGHRSPDGALRVQGRSDPRSAARRRRAAHPVEGVLRGASLDQTSLDRPLGSGPYAIGDFKPGTFVTYKRRPDYWAKDLPVNRGRFNFDELRYDYFRDRTLELEGLKSANFDFREEFTSIDWATAYDMPR